MLEIASTESFLISWLSVLFVLQFWKNLGNIIKYGKVKLHSIIGAGEITFCQK